MSNKRLIVGVLVALVLTLGYYLLLQKLQEKYPSLRQQPPQQTATAPATAPATNPSSGSDTLAPPGTTAPATAPVLAAGALRAESAPAAQSATLGSSVRNDPNFVIGLYLTARGAGIDQAVLNHFRLDVKEEAPYSFQTPYEIDPQNTVPLATRWISIDGQEVSLLGDTWALEVAPTPASPSATYAITVAGSDGPLVRMRKTYKIRPKSDPETGGYEVAVNVSFENLAGRPLTIKSAFNGPTMPPRELDYGYDKEAVAGYSDGRFTVLERHFVDSFTADQPSFDLTKDDKGQAFQWAGLSTVYFNAFLRPDPQEGAPAGAPAYIGKVEARAVNPEADAQHRAIVLVFETTDLKLNAGATTTLPMRLFLGPKERKLLKNPHYSAAPLGYQETLISPSGCTYCTFQTLIDVLVWMLNGFHFIVRDWGLAIIALVLLVRLLLHPITKKSQVSMMKMQKMGPAMEALKKKYGDNKEELNRAMMQFYKDQGATPILGCLPMFLQMPIWIALWQALNSTFELRHEPFLFGLTWIDDLSKPDHLIAMSSGQSFNLFFLHISGLNLLPFLLGVAFWLQHKYQPKPATMTPEQAQQQKMMQWMVLLFPLFLYSSPSGLNLYILASTAFGIIESKVIRDHIKKREAAEAGKGPTIIDGPPPDRPQTGKVRRKEPDAPPKKGGILGWFAELQRRAQSLQDQQKKQAKSPKKK